MDVDQQGQYLVTLRVDSLIYDKDNGRYTISLNNCALCNDDQNEENKEQEQNITFQVIDTSKVIHYEKGKFISDAAGSKNSVEDEQKINEDFKKEKDESLADNSSNSNENNNILTKKDKWFLLFWGIYIIVAILLFMVIENDTFIDALYFRIVTSFGVGYGDITPQTATGKMLNCLFIIIDLAKLAYIDWRLISLLFNYRDQKIHSISISIPNQSLNNNNINDTNNKFAKIVNNRNFLIYILILLGLFFLTGTLVMALSENYYWLDSIEWNFVTLSQVGYGNTVPINNAAKLFTVFYIIFGYVLLLALAVIIFDNFMSKIDQKNKTKVTKIELESLIESQ